MDTFALPVAIADLIASRNQLRAHYRQVLHQRGSNVDLKFTLDGNLVGDLGEAIAVELFGVQLVDTKSTEGIDGYTADRSATVQIKATGTRRGPAFRQTETRPIISSFLIWTSRVPLEPLSTTAPNDMRRSYCRRFLPVSVR